MSLHSLSFVVPMPVLLELSISVCVCVCMCREGALDGLDFFLKKTNKKPQTNGTHFVYASSKLQSRSLRFKILLLSHLGRRLSVGFLHL